MPQSFHIAICSNSDSLIKKTIDHLEEKGYKISFAKTEEELHYLIENNQVNLVLIELDFNSKDGITLTTDIRNIKDIEQPYIIIFSNKQDDDEHIILKPWQILWQYKIRVHLTNYCVILIFKMEFPKS